MTQKTIAVLGQGPMGAAVAQALLRHDTRVVVWNRTRERCTPQVGRGAAMADTPAAAVEAADLTIAVLRDPTATRSVLASVPRPVASGRAVLNFASSTPREARTLAAWATDAGIDWLSGAIMVPTPLIGEEEALFLYSGNRAAMDAHLDVLQLLGGDNRHLGDDHGLASLLDTAMLEIFFAGMTSFLHASAMVTAQGFSATDFAPLAKVMVEILPATLDGLARDVDNGEYPGEEDNLAMELSAITHIADTSDELGLDSRLPRLMEGLAAAAVADGHGGNGWSRVVEGLRKSTA